MTLKHDREAELEREVVRLGNVAAGRLRWLSMMLAGGEHHEFVAYQAREWADEMDPNKKAE